MLFIFYASPIYPFKLVLSDNSANHNLTSHRISTPSEANAVSVILDNYGEKNICVSKYVLVSIHLALDKELRWNYTTKAKIAHQFK